MKTLEQKIRLIEQQEKSKLDAAEFCRRKGLNPSTFSDWKKKLGSQHVSRFIDVTPEMTPVEKPVKWSLELRIGSRFSLSWSTK